MSTSTSHPLVRLADHVRACRIENQVIFLDLLRDSYIAVGGAGLPTLTANASQGDLFGEASSMTLPDELVRSLLERKLLVNASSCAPSASRSVLSRPVTGLESAGDDHTLDWTLCELVRLWQATLITSKWLRNSSLAQIVDRVLTLRATRSLAADADPPDAIRAAVATYIRLRPFALTSHDRCLNDSLALVHFLATRRLFPKWVIGVRVRPFGAHSWVQSGDVVLNDLAERVRRYQPILVV